MVCALEVGSMIRCAGSFCGSATRTADCSGSSTSRSRGQTPGAWAGKIRVAALLGALLVGLGFMLGGLMHGPTDPGVAVLAVPAGAMLLLSSLVATALLRPSDHL
jgi:hypothetical protein